MLPPKRRATQVVGRYRIFDVLRHDLEAAPGGLADAYALDVRDWVAVVPVTADGQVVLVRQYRHGIDGFTLEVPGGMIDAGESPADAAARELREETGFAATRPLEPLGSAHPNPPLQANRYSMFLARDVVREGAPAFDHGEDCEVVLRPLDEVRRTLGEGEMTHALVNHAIARAIDVLGADGAARDAQVACLDEVLADLGRTEALHAQKVIELARRIHPGLTAEDIRNPHDFPDLVDPDWHFADGQLSGIQSVAVTLRVLRDRIARGGRP